MRLLISYLKEKNSGCRSICRNACDFLYIILVKNEVPFDVIEYGAELSAIWLLFVGSAGISGFIGSGIKVCWICLRHFRMN